jgi:hypothetical protein
VNEPFEDWFNYYVFGFMLRDVSREIAAAQQNEDAANFLCAIGLLAYTEALGGHVPGVKRGSRNRFEAFFRRLGAEYEAFLEAHPAYDLFRNGLLHEYRVKKPATIVMLDRQGVATCGVMYETLDELRQRDEEAFANSAEDDRDWLELSRAVNAQRTEGQYYLVVQRYFRDFVVAADLLHRQVAGHRHPLIHIYAPDLLP